MDLIERAARSTSRRVTRGSRLRRDRWYRDGSGPRRGSDVVDEGAVTRLRRARDAEVRSSAPGGAFLTIALLAALVGVAVLLVLGPQLQTSLLGDVPAPLSWALAAARFVLALRRARRPVRLRLLDRPEPRPPVVGLDVAGGVVRRRRLAGRVRRLHPLRADLGGYEKTYGTIAGVAVLLIWLQLSMMVILSAPSSMPRSSGRRHCTCAVAEGAGFGAPGSAARASATAECASGDH